MTWQGVCSECSEPVKGSSNDGTLKIPVGGQKAICLICLCFCNEEEEGGEA
jgi:hypothetical protein